MLPHASAQRITADPPRPLTSTLGEYRRRALFRLFSLRDIFDTYLAPSTAPTDSPLGFRIVGGNSQHHKAMQKGTFELAEVRWLQHELESASVFVDVGANIGYFSCLARTLGKHVIAVEPLHSNVQHLLRNIEMNSGPMPEVHAVALSDAAGVMKLYGASSTGASLVRDWAGASSRLSRLVPVSTLDAVLSDRFLDDHMVIKVDVEGSEIHTLAGARETLHRANKPTWLVEIAMGEFMPGGHNPNFLKTFELFWDAGYVSFLLTESGRIPINRTDIERFESRGRSDHAEINYIFEAPGR